MQAILFYLDVIAFLMVVYWIYGVEQRGKSPGKGLLGMQEPESTGVAAPMQPTSRWRQVEAPPAKTHRGKPRAHEHAAPERSPPGRPGPGRPGPGHSGSVTPMPSWRRTLRYGRPPPKV